MYIGARNGHAARRPAASTSIAAYIHIHTSCTRWSLPVCTYLPCTRYSEWARAEQLRVDFVSVLLHDRQHEIAGERAAGQSGASRVSIYTHTHTYICTRAIGSSTLVRACSAVRLGDSVSVRADDLSARSNPSRAPSSFVLEICIYLYRGLYTYICRVRTNCTRLEKIVRLVCVCVCWPDLEVLIFAVWWEAAFRGDCLL